MDPAVRCPQKAIKHNHSFTVELTKQDDRVSVFYEDGFLSHLSVEKWQIYYVSKKNQHEKG